MKEELLHYVWKMNRFNFRDLVTTRDERIVIREFGVHNHNAGPDFLNAKILIDKTLWVGHIEIHVNASDWYRHNHDSDPAYDNVILHVVYNCDKEIHNSQQHWIPCLSLAERIDNQLIANYEKLNKSLDWVPCAAQLNKVQLEKTKMFLQSVFIGRLARKSLIIQSLLTKHNHDWESVLYILMLKYLGMKVNGLAFERLSEVLPYQLLKKYAHNIQALEALFFGQAGLIVGKDNYQDMLAREYSFLAKKHKLIAMTGLEWKFLRLRPANFPTIRMAQMAALIHKSPKLFSRIIQYETSQDLEALLCVETSKYWETHYMPGKVSRSLRKSIGASTRKNLLINVITPLVFTYAKVTGNENLREKAIEVLYDVTSESNSIVKRWQEHGIKSPDAATSQALIELKLNYCDQYHCLNCSIGQQLLFT